MLPKCSRALMAVVLPSQVVVVRIQPVHDGRNCRQRETSQQPTDEKSSEA
jgi:hypothetical protein